MTKYIHKNYILGAGEMTQQPRAAHAENLGSIPSTHTVSGDPVPSSDSKVLRDAFDVQTHMQAEHS